MNSKLKNNYQGLRSALVHLRQCHIKGSTYRNAVSAIAEEYRGTKHQIRKQLVDSKLSISQIAKKLGVPLADVLYQRLKGKLPDGYDILKRSMVIFYQINRLGSETFTPVVPVDQMTRDQMLMFVKQTLAVIDEKTMYPDGDHYLVGGNPHDVLEDIHKMQKQSHSIKSILKSVDIEIYNILHASGPYTLGFVDDEAYESMHKLVEYVNTYCFMHYDWENVHAKAEF